MGAFAFRQKDSELQNVQLVELQHSVRDEGSRVSKELVHCAQLRLFASNEVRVEQLTVFEHINHHISFSIVESGLKELNIELVWVGGLLVVLEMGQSQLQIFFFPFFVCLQNNIILFNFVFFLLHLCFLLFG